jgi:beta-1,4-mannosyltransferase
MSAFLPSSSPPYSTPFTYMNKEYDSPTASPSYSPIESPSSRPERPALLVSSTSWTPDEDFNMLLDALGIYDRKAREVNRTKGHSGGLPKVLMIVTGKGPLKEKYMRRVAELQTGNQQGEGWEWIRFISLWLEAEDYPKLLGLPKS